MARISSICPYKVAEVSNKGYTDTNRGVKQHEAFSTYGKNGDGRNIPTLGELYPYFGKKELREKEQNRLKLAGEPAFMTRTVGGFSSEPLWKTIEMEKDKAFLVHRFKLYTYKLQIADELLTPENVGGPGLFIVENGVYVMRESERTYAWLLNKENDMRVKVPPSDDLVLHKTADLEFLFGKGIEDIKVGFRFPGSLLVGTFMVGGPTKHYGYNAVFMSANSELTPAVLTY